ncbi:MAG: extracellular solute-binding protein [Blautia sp.]|nr:extracellular solute-binding protein [Blautia sp.]
MAVGSVLVLGASFAGCAGRQDMPYTEGQEDGGAGQELPAWERLRDEEPVTLDWYINYSWFAMPWGGNVTSDAITEETGVSVNFIAPMGNEAEKLNALIAADNLPDLITLGYWEPQLEEMVNSGMVCALNELADEYDAYFWEVTDPTVVNWYTQKDGNIYAYPNSAVTPQDLEENKNIGSNKTFLVRKDIYEAIGSPDMSTQEGFCAAVREAARQFPEVDGKPLIPIGSHVFDDYGCTSFDKYLMDFLAVDRERDGKLYDRYTDGEYLSWLKMFRQLGEEGYLANDIFVDTRTQMEEKLEEGRYFCMLYQYTDLLAEQKNLYAKNPDSIYMAVEGPRNKAGDDPTLAVNNVNGWTVTLISKKCKDCERAIAFLDYLLSEHGQKRIYLGVEGETYEMVDGRPVLYEEVSELLATDRIAYDRIYGADDTYWMQQNLVMQLQWEQEASPAVQQLKEWSRKYPCYDGAYDIYFPSGSKEAQQHSDIVHLWSNTLPALLLAPSEEEFDAIMEDFIRQRDALGYDALMEAATLKMIESKEKLGIE